MQGLKMIGIICLMSVYIPVLANDLFRYWFIFHLLREQGKSTLTAKNNVIQDLTDHLCREFEILILGIDVLQERAPKNEIRILLFSIKLKK